MKLLTFLAICCNFYNYSYAHDYWQQRVEYKMDIDFEVKNHHFEGRQILKYYNNSSDTLHKVYYHLYFNAFQPNSMMDVRSRTIADPDSRVGSRISRLSPDEIGYQKIQTLAQDGKPLRYQITGTILEVELQEPIVPGGSTTFQMEFEGQVPLQIRRSGRDSFEGIDYSMAQWFPKMAEYDEMGWHTHPYVGREFYAPWGDYDVKITIDKDYVLAGTGILQNPDEIGYGYEDEGVTVNHKGKDLTWHFKAENVHDFVWAADTEYTQVTAQVPGGPLLRFFYVPGEETKLWEDLPDYTVKAFQFIEENFGKYGWDEYSIIQGGDGGMEYPMATLIANKKPSGVRSLSSLVGVTIHEALHSWYQGMLATNESYYAWMDEGFTSWAENYTKAHVMNESGNPMAEDLRQYIMWTRSGYEEPQSTHADHFTTNSAYSRASYTKGAVSLEQLGYIIGDQNRDQGLLRYYNQWAFKHPDMNDFIRIMEKQSGLELHWFFEYWVNTTETIDYSVKPVEATTQNGTAITIRREEKIPMPMDITITTTDGDKLLYYIPIGLMRGEKPAESGLERTVGKDWFWTHQEYTFELEIPIDDISRVEIDASGRLADINRIDNIYNITTKTIETPTEDEK